jgi:hypothetical protein
MANEQREDKNRSRFASYLLLLGMLVGFLLGFLFHDFLVDHNPITHTIKNWYPR